MSEGQAPLHVGGDGFDGERYQARLDAMLAAGGDFHGEADFVMAYAPESVLDAGCGTARVGLELARRGVLVVGADRDASMLIVARRLGAQLAGEESGTRISFVEENVAELDVGTFDVVVMAGNVPLFTPEGTQAALVAGAARHVARPGGVLISGFQLDRGYTVAMYDLHCAAVGLELAERYASWDRQEFVGGHYAVSVHRPAQSG